MIPQKKILFISEASEKIGFGHFSRSIELYKQFLINGDFNIYFLIAIDKKKLVHFLKSRGLTFSDHFICFDSWNYQRIIESLNKTFFSCVVFDLQSEHSELRSYFSNSKSKTLSLDFFFQQNCSDVIVNLFNHKLSHEYTETCSKTKILSGPKYSIIRDKFKLIRHERSLQQVDRPIQNILIAMGGSDPNNLTMKIIHRLQKLRFINQIKEISIVIGPLFSESQKNKINRLAISVKSLRVFIEPENFESFFLNNDLIFCGGGTTLLESMSCGMPAIVIPQSQEELNHATSYAKKNACIVYDKAENIAENFFDLSLLNKIKNNALNTVDHYGKNRILEIVTDLINE
jgi:spore coat polysaccharide biosynthesis predicted glycosyltransferase SpsG